MYKNGGRTARESIEQAPNLKKEDGGSLRTRRVEPDDRPRPGARTDMTGRRPSRSVGHETRGGGVVRRVRQK